MLKFITCIFLIAISVMCFANTKSKVLICVAMPEECEGIIEEFNYNKISDNIFENEKSILIITGIGKVNAALWTQYGIDHYNISYIFNYGFVGDNTKKLKLNDIILPEKVMQHDFNMQQEGYVLGQVQGQDKYIFKNNTDLYYKLKLHIPIKKVEYLLTGDRFVPEDLRGIENSVSDMEGYAIARVAYNAKKPVLFIKFNSNDCSFEGVKEYEKDFDNCKKELFKNVKQIIAAL